MIRRHSLADISSLATDPFDSLGYPHNTYHDPNNEFTIYTLRRASSPVMLPTMTPTARTTVTAPEAAMPEVDGQDQPKTAKKKNKKKAKKKANSRNNNKGEGNGVVGVEGGGESVEGNVNNVNDNNNNNASMPLIVNGASLKHRTDQMSGISTEVCLLPLLSTIHVTVTQY